MVSGPRRAILSCLPVHHRSSTSLSRIQTRGRMECAYPVFAIAWDFCRTAEPTPGFQLFSNSQQILGTRNWLTAGSYLDLLAPAFRSGWHCVSQRAVRLFSCTSHVFVCFLRRDPFSVSLGDSAGYGDRRSAHGRQLQPPNDSFFDTVDALAFLHRPSVLLALSLALAGLCSYALDDRPGIAVGAIDSAPSDFPCGDRVLLYGRAAGPVFEACFGTPPGCCRGVVLLCNDFGCCPLTRGFQASKSHLAQRHLTR